MPEFHARYPEIQIDLGVSDRLVDLIDENVDCVIRGGELRDQSLMARRVGDLQLGVYAAPAYLQRAGVPSHPRELEDSHQRIVGFLWARTGKALPYAMRRGEECLRVAGRHVLAVDDGNAYLAAGLAGLGILWLPHYMAREPLARGELLPLFEDWSLEPMPLYLAFPPNRHVSGKLRVFIEWVAELIARHAPPLHPRSETRAAAYPGKPWSNGKRPGLYICPAIIEMTYTTISRISWNSTKPTSERFPSGEWKIHPALYSAVVKPDNLKIRISLTRSHRQLHQ